MIHCSFVAQLELQKVFAFTSSIAPVGRRRHEAVLKAGNAAGQGNKATK